MPHVSKKKISKKVQAELDQKLIDIISKNTVEAKDAFLSELLTDTERLMLAKRLLLLILIHKKVSSRKISYILGISTSTVARFELKYSNNKYVSLIHFINQNRSPFRKISDEILAILNEPYRRKGSFARRLKDI